MERPCCSEHSHAPRESTSRGLAPRSRRFPLVWSRRPARRWGSRSHPRRLPIRPRPSCSVISQMPSSSPKPAASCADKRQASPATALPARPPGGGDPRERKSQAFLTPGLVWHTLCPDKLTGAALKTGGANGKRSCRDVTPRDQHLGLAGLNCRDLRHLLRLNGKRRGPRV